MTPAYENPFLWLQTVEMLAKRQATGLPRGEQIVRKIWKGIAFRLDDVFLVAQLTEIREIITCPKILARVPGAKTWVRGIANIRGMLVPVADLQLCLSGKKSTRLDVRTRLMILNQAGVSSGVLVDEVLGIKHFPEDELDTRMSYGEQWYTPFVSGSFTDEEQTWLVFNMFNLTKSRVFLEAAL
jgi:twitching motility protein PilI